MSNGDKITINLILERNGGDKNKKDLEKFEELKTYHGIAKPNTEIIRECIRAAHKLILG